MAEAAPTIPTTPAATTTTPPTAPATETPLTPPGPPEWTKDPLYAGVVAKVPAKFIRATPAETLAAQAESYAELEKHKSKPPTPGTSPTTTEPKVEAPKADDAAPLTIEPPKAPEAVTEKGAFAVIAAAGLKDKIHEMVKAWKETGELLPEHYEALDKQGWDRDSADPLVESLINRAEKPIKAALELAGGREAFNNMASLAAAKMDKAMLAKLNAQLQTKDAPDAMLALMGWYSRETGTAGSGRIEPGNGVARSSPPKTLAEAKELNARALKGDMAAAASLRGVDISKLS